MADRVKPLKMEGADAGGTQEDVFPTSLNINEDSIDARGLFVQNGTSNDDVVHVSRDASNNMTLKDGIIGTKTLLELLSTIVKSVLFLTTEVDHAAIALFVPLK